jgi:hypothetical protein
MLIHLGKVYLGQTDRLDITANRGGIVQPIFRFIETLVMLPKRTPGWTVGLSNG